MECMDFCKEYKTEEDVSSELEELIAKNQEKRAKKLKKMGIDSGSAMAEYAKYSTKSIDVKTTKDYANMVKNVSENDVTEEKKENTGKTGESSGGSISKYANMLKDRK